jgi:amidase
VVEENSNTITIAWLGDWGGSYPIQEGILDLCRSALDMLTERASIEDLSSTPPMDTASLWMSWTTIRSKVIADSFRFEHGEETLLKAPLRTEVLWEVKRGMGMTELEVERAKSLAKEWSDCAASLFEKYDILALPTAQVWPFPAHERWPRSINGIEMDTYHRWMEIVVPCSLAGLPCVTLPAGFGKTGLSMGLQIIGPRFSDAKLLSIAEMYHMLTDWPSKQPPEIITPKRSALL